MTPGSFSSLALAAELLSERNEERVPWLPRRGVVKVRFVARFLKVAEPCPPIKSLNSSDVAAPARVADADRARLATIALFADAALAGEEILRGMEGGLGVTPNTCLVTKERENPDMRSARFGACAKWGPR